MCAQPMRSLHSCCCPIRKPPHSAHRTRAIARSARALPRSLVREIARWCARAIARWGAASLAGAREPSLAGARDRSLRAREPSLAGARHRSLGGRHRALCARVMLCAALVARELALAAREAARTCARQRALWRSSLAAHTRLPWLAPRPCPSVHCSWHTTQGRAAALCSCTTPLLIAFVPHGRRAPLLVVACPHYTTPLKGNT